MLYHCNHKLISNGEKLPVVYILHELSPFNFKAFHYLFKVPETPLKILHIAFHLEGLH